MKREEGSCTGPGDGMKVIQISFYIFLLLIIQIFLNFYMFCKVRNHSDIEDFQFNE